MTAVFRHELRMMFSSLTAYVYGMFSLLAVAIYMMYYNLSVGYANFEYALAGASFALLIMIPIITMRIIAEEKKQKTDQLLYSLPISTTQVVVGKFLAVFVTSVIPLRPLTTRSRASASSTSPRRTGARKVISHPAATVGRPVALQASAKVESAKVKR